ncbi:MAG: GyrI-like domain-containing protein [Pseudomonadota bacterium]|nr:GyrI-like domain-containing protein [Pseudomonadota bacterium]
MIDTPQIARSAPQRTAAIPVIIARNEIQQAFPPAVNELLAAMREQGIEPAGPLFSYHRKMPGAVFDMEIGFPVDDDVTAQGRVVASALPATRVARTIYRGPMEGIGAAWGELKAWVAANGLTTQPFIWENYLVGPGDNADASTWQTELNWPLAD